MSPTAQHPLSHLNSYFSDDDLPRLVQHLTPRYTGHFQTKGIYRFLTYEAAASLSIFLTNVTAQRAARNMQAMVFAATCTSPLLKAMKEGLDIGDDVFIFSLSTHGREEHPESDVEMLDTSRYLVNVTGRPQIEMLGDIVPTSTESFDMALWKLGGSRVSLRLIDLASVSRRNLYNSATKLAYCNCRLLMNCQERLESLQIVSNHAGRWQRTWKASVRHTRRKTSILL